MSMEGLCHKICEFFFFTRKVTDVSGSLVKEKSVTSRDIPCEKKRTVILRDTPCEETSKAIPLSLPYHH